MTRDEAARVLKYLWIERDENAKSMQQLTKSFFERQEALRIGVAALRGPQPDPDTGLVPCGCGGKAKIWSSDPTQFTHVITDYEVGCTECAMTTGWERGKQENAIKVWNKAMGYTDTTQEQ